MRLSAILRPIEREMTRVEARLAEELRAEDPVLAQLTRHVGEYRGKRLRPALVLFSGRCLGEISHEHIELAVAVELVHTATLVHDDILDEATLRRNSPTIHAKWGPDVAVVLGDYLLARAFSVIAAFKSAEATRQLLHATTIMCEGEIHQLHRQHALDVDENEYLRIIERKTASLCAACCRLGALCTGSADGFAEDLARYGVNVGIAFQIADDCLDITGEEDRVGKTLYTDLQKGKLTLPLIRLVSLTPKEKREELRRILFSQNARDAVAALLPALRTHGAIEYAFVRAADHIETAKRHLRRLADSMFKDGLLALADYVLARDR